VIGVYLLLPTQNIMRRTVQTKLSDFDDTCEPNKSEGPQDVPEASKSGLPSDRPRTSLWSNVITPDEEWGVCNFDDTVLFTQIIDRRLHAHGMEIKCKWCEGNLEVREDKVFCSGTCRRYQGEFSQDLEAYLWWEGAKSYTLRREIADAEGLELEQRDLEEISYAPNWSVLSEYDENLESEDFSEE
jgi:hypothetical protein